MKKYFSSPDPPQANGQVEAVNKTIKYTLKRKVDASKGLGLMSYLKFYGSFKVLVERL